MLRLQQRYKKEVVSAMMQKFGYKSVMAVPKVKKIVVNAGFGKMVAAKTGEERGGVQKHIQEYLSLMTGQQPVLKKAKKSIAAFKLREGTPIGATVILRRKRMYDFLEKLIWLVLPRLRDFRGLDPASVTDQGDLSIGFREFAPFPEVKIEKEKGIFGLEVTISTNAKSKAEGLELLRLIGMPIKK